MPGFPYTFPFAYPLGGDEDLTGPAVSFALSGAVHENRTIPITVSDLTSIDYVRIEIHYPTGYYEVAYETPGGTGEFSIQVSGWGRFYGGSTSQTLEPIEGVAKLYNVTRDLHWPNDFTVKVTAKDHLGNTTPL